MSDVGIMTDSNSGITVREGKELGIHVIPMPFLVDGELFYEGIDLTQEDFYLKLSQKAEVSTSQPSPGEVMDMWDKLLDSYKEIVYIPMSSGLSHSCETAKNLSEEYDGRVRVVDNQRISVTQRQSVLDALSLAKTGRSALEIKEILEKDSKKASIYIMVDTLEYLKKGGRITAAGAAIGTVLNIKPVLQIQGSKLDAYGKVRGVKAARRVMTEAMKDDFNTRLKEYDEKGQMRLYISYSYIPEEFRREWLEEVEKAFPNRKVGSDPLALSIGCHIGPGALAIAACKVPDQAGF